MNLQLFLNRCGRCGLEFTSLHQPRAYEAVLYSSRSGVLRYLDPDTDDVWRETASLIDQATAGMAISAVDKARLQHGLLARTIDPVGENDGFASAWETRPCPRCESRDRAYFGPVDPPRFEEVEVEAVTHRQWSARSAEEKIAEAHDVVRSTR